MKFEWNRRNIALIVLVVFSIFSLIAGFVMIGISIHQSRENHSMPAMLPTAVYTTSWTDQIQWSDDLANPMTPLFQNVSGMLMYQIMNALSPPGPPPKSEQDMVIPPMVWINRFTKSVSGQGVDFYSTIIYILAFNYSAIQPTLQANGWISDITLDPTSQCIGLKNPSLTTIGTPLPSGETTISTLSTTPGVPTTSGCNVNPTQPLPNGAYCDASSHNVLSVFAVDVAQPDMGTLDDKLAKIRAYLLTMDASANLPQTGTWNSVTYIVVAYAGDQAIPLNTPCSDHNCWVTTVSSLNTSTVNPTLNGFHRLTTALQYIDDNLSNQPMGRGRNLIIITDGYDVTAPSATPLATKLKTEMYSIGAIVATTSTGVRQMIQQCVTDNTYMYPLDSYDWISNPSVIKQSSLWICTAFYPTQPPPTNSPTPIPLKTSSMFPVTPSQGTNSSGLNCAVDALFMMDDSQFMYLSGGYQQGIALIQSLAQQLYSSNAASRFALLTFNTQTVYSSPNYQSYNDFMASIATPPQIQIGSPDYANGFNSARTIIKTSRYNDGTVRPLLVFISDGWSDSATTLAVSPIATDLRNTYATDIIAIGLAETSQVAFQTQTALGIGAGDSYVQATYIGVPDSAHLTNPDTVNQTISSVQCRNGVTPPKNPCPVDLTFMLEVSQIEGDSYIGVETRLINNLLSQFSSYISPSLGSVSLVYYSSPDNLPGNPNGKSGILYQQITDTGSAIASLANYNFDPLGGATDVNTGMKYLLQSQQSDKSKNARYTVWIGRGSYDQVGNCCQDPSGTAAQVRQISSIQGVVLGPYSNKTYMDTYSGSNSIDGNSLVVKDGSGNIDQIASATAIQNVVAPILLNALKSGTCVVPPAGGVCQEFVDITIIMHATTSSNWQTITSFVASKVLPDLLGTITATPMNQGMYVNLAILSYSGVNVVTLADFTTLKSAQDYVNMIQNAQFVADANNPYLSKAYQVAGTIMGGGRSAASKTVLVISDMVSDADLLGALTARGNMPYCFVYGILAMAGQSTIPGQDDGVTVASVQQLGDGTATTASAELCQYLPPPVFTSPKPSTAAPTPGPIPVVKARMVWPDVTILIDTTGADNNGNPGMTNEGFEQLRTFLKTTFLGQFNIGRTHSRFSVATFNNVTNIVCTFADITNYWDFFNCLDSKLSLDPSVTRSSTRDINGALTTLKSKIYGTSASADYRPLKENFLFVFTLGSSATPMTTTLSGLQHQGIRSIGVALSNTMDNVELSQYGPDSFKVQNWMDPNQGLNGQNNLAGTILRLTTNKQRPTPSSFFADFYFVVDQSGEVQADNNDVVQFVSDFIAEYTLSQHKVRVSILPYADVARTSLPLTGDSNQYNQYLATWRAMGAPGSTTSNIGSVLQEIFQQLPGTYDRATYLIYIVGAANSLGASKAAAFQSMPLTTIALQFHNTVTYSSYLAPSNKTYTVNSGAALRNWVDSVPVNPQTRNPMNMFFNDLFDAQQTYDSGNFPTSEVTADIVFLVDETGLSASDFEMVKQYLVNITNDFQVGPRDCQFALQAYNGHIIPEAGFHFWQSKDETSVTNTIMALRLDASPEPGTAADLAGAINQVETYFLTAANGWREDSTTYVIIVSHAQQFYNGNTSVDTALNITQTAKLYALGTNGNTYPFVNQFINSGIYTTVPSPSQLTTDAAASTAIIAGLTQDYKQQVYPVLPALNMIDADHVFLIDNYVQSGQSSNIGQIKNFLNSFVQAIGNFSTGGNRLGVINYDSQGVRTQTTWNLNAYNNPLDLINAINSLDIVGTPNPTDLHSAIDYFYTTPSTYGIYSGRPVFITLIATSPTIVQPIPTIETKTINANWFTYSIQTTSSTQYSYMNQFLGTDLGDFVYSPDLQLNIGSTFDNYKNYVRSEYSAWQSTYGTR